MSTRRTVSADQLFPITDPESILRHASAERRRRAQQILPFLTTEDTLPDTANSSLIPLPHSSTVPTTSHSLYRPSSNPPRAPHHQPIARSTTLLRYRLTPPRHAPLEAQRFWNRSSPTPSNRDSDPPQSSPHQELPSPFLKDHSS
ncbi:hypothetical protein H4Q26_016298 [Puccinia striiformis f. sp. tritici PST-130]|nr:hypothetical protein H4Q26_016298 [Puccinia striiformis f. sp. tritici PST-130]